MKNVVRYIVTGILTLFVLWGTSCSHDTENFSLSDRGTALSIGFRLPIRSLETDEGYEVGETYENYIDVENSNYRIISLPPIISLSPVLNRMVSW